MIRRKQAPHDLEPYADRVFGRDGLWCAICGRVFNDIDDHELMRYILLAAKVSAA